MKDAYQLGIRNMRLDSPLVRNHRRGSQANEKKTKTTLPCF